MHQNYTHVISFFVLYFFPLSIVSVNIQRGNMHVINLASSATDYTELVVRKWSTYTSVAVIRYSKIITLTDKILAKWHEENVGRN